MRRPRTLSPGFPRSQANQHAPVKDCRVPKLFRQETSPQLMVKLTDKKIEWAVEQVINKGESTEMVAAIYGVYRKRIQQLVKYYMETGAYA